MYPAGDWRTRTDPVSNNGIPEVFREFTYNVSFYVVPLVTGCTGVHRARISFLIPSRALRLN